MNIPPALRAMRHYNFRLYFVGQAISLIGTWMQRIAVSWLVYNLTHSAFMLGVVAFAGQIPVLLLPLHACAFADEPLPHFITYTNHPDDTGRATGFSCVEGYSGHNIPQCHPWYYQSQ